MNKEMTILIIAQNGLKTAAALFASKSAKLDKQLLKLTDKKEIAAMKKRVGKAKKLASILTAADEGITAYIRESAEDDE